MIVLQKVSPVKMQVVGHQLRVPVFYSKRDLKRKVKYIIISMYQDMVGVVS